MIDLSSNSSTLKSFDVSGHRTASFHLYDEYNPQRMKAETAVKKIFRSAYGADISSYLPYLLTAEAYQSVDAVVGLRRALDQTLFLEQYLPQPIEYAIKDINGLTVSRKNLIEIGNLVSCKAGISRQLFIVLALALAKADIEWVSFTATSQVEKLLAKLSLFPVVIGQANAQAIVSGEDSWGSYYVHSPNVSVGNVFNAVFELKKSLAIRELAIRFAPTIDSIAEQLTVR